MTVPVHTFETTEEAYDSIQSGDIPLMSILHIPSEKVVGIADVYPIAVTSYHGQLYHIPDVYTSFSMFIEDWVPMREQAKEFMKSWNAAKELAESNGYHTRF